eukprot:CAMPEP_0206049298 /NCGR_PEP_ID=MMETSP1466-20131121/26447_1 /ASSEMBLY_ACC=CAM_ASM_001126 /TAXON_ID=44452 /ORGANISM="Pavlova gyrans, Strain CCMP608" /LENGTH=59 /DNA_ID=CAMNT_0053424379 /DNA_START=441 /DNA_END=620 /DNA_ORIENTATION=+
MTSVVPGEVEGEEEGEGAGTGVGEDGFAVQVPLDEHEYPELQSLLEQHLPHTAQLPSME